MQFSDLNSPACQTKFPRSRFYIFHTSQYKESMFEVCPFFIFFHSFFILALLDFCVMKVEPLVCLFLTAPV